MVWYNGESSGTYDYFFHLALSPSDLVYSATKAVFFAGIVTLVHCSCSYFASGGQGCRSGGRTGFAHIDSRDRHLRRDPDLRPVGPGARDSGNGI